MNQQRLQRTDYEEFLDRDDFIDRFRAEDDEASIALLEYGLNHFVPMLTYSFPALQKADAEDICMVVYVDFFKRKCPSYEKTEGTFRSWAYAVVIKAAISYLQKRND